MWSLCELPRQRTEGLSSAPATPEVVFNQSYQPGGGNRLRLDKTHPNIDQARHYGYTPGDKYLNFYRLTVLKLLTATAAASTNPLTMTWIYGLMLRRFNPLMMIVMVSTPNKAPQTLPTPP